MAKKKPVETPPAPQFSDFKQINVPIPAVRMELAQLQKDGFEYMPLDAFLLMIHRLVKEDTDGQPD